MSEFIRFLSDKYSFVLSVAKMFALFPSFLMIISSTSFDAPPVFNLIRYVSGANFLISFVLMWSGIFFATESDEIASIIILSIYEEYLDSDTYPEILFTIKSNSDFSILDLCLYLPLSITSSVASVDEPNFHIFLASKNLFGQKDIGRAVQADNGRSFWQVSEIWEVFVPAGIKVKDGHDPLGPEGINDIPGIGPPETLKYRGGIMKGRCPFLYEKPPLDSHVF